ncbi:hypothetical protein [Oceanobacter sp. 4_MG-2023]|nr:hypothetical protein [Oceanobacter sp. 4_MG-2023]MDP2546799.1 hypothetical protein [Oceanobacter sp. 4_MG-2023]
MQHHQATSHTVIPGSHLAETTLKSMQSMAIDSPAESRYQASCRGKP